VKAFPLALQVVTLALVVWVVLKLDSIERAASKTSIQLEVVQ
jgi:hypothetical protein